ncbi:MAG: sulfate/molybdate ABC transporter ATP-binding protein [Mycobacteriaceae bacterium]
MNGLQVDLQYAARHLDLKFSVEKGKTLALFGPNGAGKSTVLSIIAGILKPDSGIISINSKVLTDISKNIHHQVHLRSVTTLSQNPLLFPHLSVLHNVAFAPRSKGESRKSSLDCAWEWLHKLGVAELAGRAPETLSGGQAQRIAIARALAAKPNLLLLDEPLSALDVAASQELRQLLQKVLQENNCTTLLVTHDPLDALALSDRAIVVESGRLTESGPTRTLLTTPQSSFAAKIADINLVEGDFCARGELITPWGTKLYGLQASDYSDKGLALFKPNAISVHPSAPPGNLKNQVPVIISEILSHAGCMRVRGKIHPEGTELAADITLTAAAELALTLGQKVVFVIKAQEVLLQPQFSR